MNLTGWLVFLGILILTFIIVWALLNNRPKSGQIPLHDIDEGDHKIETDEHQLTEPANPSEVNPISEEETNQSVVASKSEKLENDDLPDIEIAQTNESETSDDDLEIIEGIGPKIAQILKNSGIATFKQLANTDTQELRSILRKANLSISDPSSWPEQAKLASKGDLDSLQALQKNLKGGRG